MGGISWFERELERKVWNGIETSFWKDVWLGNEAFCVTYPRLFSILSHQDIKVVKCGVAGNGRVSGYSLGGEICLCGRWS